MRSSGCSPVRRRSAWRLATYAGLSVVALLAIALLRGGAGIPCLIQSIWGFRCPACGATTALDALLRLDFLSAFQANPLFTTAIYPLAGILFLQDIGLAICNLLQGKREYVSFLRWICGEGKGL